MCRAARIFSSSSRCFFCSSFVRAFSILSAIPLWLSIFFLAIIKNFYLQWFSNYPMQIDRVKTCSSKKTALISLAKFIVLRLFYQFEHLFISCFFFIYSGSAPPIPFLLLFYLSLFISSPFIEAALISCFFLAYGDAYSEKLFHIYEKSHLLYVTVVFCFFFLLRALSTIMKHFFCLYTSSDQNGPQDPESAPDSRKKPSKIKKNSFSTPATSTTPCLFLWQDRSLLSWSFFSCFHRTPDISASSGFCVFSVSRALTPLQTRSSKKSTEGTRSTTLYFFLNFCFSTLSPRTASLSSFSVQIQRHLRQRTYFVRSTLGFCQPYKPPT